MKLSKIILLFSNFILLLADQQPEIDNDTVAQTLLNWKSSLDDESRKLLSSWARPDPCKNWVGIGCNKNNITITSINLENFHLQGNLDSFNFSTLSSLESLNPGNNRLTGPIRSEIRYLRKLKDLNFSSNQLTGRIPLELGELRLLENLDLGSNDLDGQIPISLGHLAHLYFLGLEDNKLSGPIPSSFGNFTRIEYLYLQKNQLTGPILPSIGNPRTLIDLRLYDNFLTGSIPGPLGNYTRLVSLYLHQNQLSGSIPIALGKLKTLLDLALSVNNLTGPFPKELNNLTMKLETLSLGSNRLSGHIPTHACFSRSLLIFSVNNNSFSGPVPSTIKNCSKLIRLRFDGNQITGNVSDAFGVYRDLEYIDLSYNNLYGEVSTDWSLCSKLTNLKMSNNNLSGTTPNNLGSSRLQELHLSSNHLTGDIPTSLGRLTSLIGLFLDDNRLSGNIPPALGKLSNLVRLNLGDNDLTGAIPREIGDCSRLLILNLSGNYLLEGFPVELTSLAELQVLDLSYNGLTGGLPRQFGGLKMLETLNISHNFTGSIPTTFVDLLSLTTIDISYNQLEGRVPDMRVFQQAPFEALENNKGLCGNITGLKDCPRTQINEKTKNNRRLMISIIVPTICLVLILILILGISIFLRRTKKKETGPPKPANHPPFAIWSYDGRMMYETIIDVVNDFNSKHVIGVGGCGTVYRAELPTGEPIAIKKFNTQEPDELVDSKSFENEVCALTETRHHNIMRLYGFCAHPRHTFLVYEFRNGGSLRNLLNDAEKTKEFDWCKRANVIKGVADALSYLHHDCLEPIVHRDLSSSNVLLDSEYSARVSDFGTAKFLKTCSSNWTSFAGTYGYSIPELAYSLVVNEKCDVYSFGIVTLKVMMGKHTRDLISLSSRSNVKELANNVVLDQRLQPPTDHVAEVVNFCVDLALMCVNANPSMRPSMRQVSVKLAKIITS